MREITGHIVPEAVHTVTDGEGYEQRVAELTVSATDALGPGGANHHYRIEGFNCAPPMEIVFQKGGIVEAGTNGLTHEILLAIVIDRLESFQKGPYPSEYNSKALHYASMALECLKQRTRERVARGVEGKAVA